MFGGQLGEGGGGAVDGVVGQVRVGDVALFAVHGEVAGERAAPSVFDGVAQHGHGGGFADDAVVYGFAARFEGFNHAHGAVAGVTFFVGGNQQGDAAFVVWVFGDEGFAGGNEGGDAAFHVGRAASVESAVALGGLEGGRCPLFGRARGDDVGVPGEAQQRLGRAAPQPEVFGVAEVHFFGGETEGGEAFGDEPLAALVVGGYGGAGDKFFGKGEGGMGHGGCSGWEAV